MDVTLKLVVVGDGSVGKTCLLISYSQNKFPEEHVPTVFDNYNAHVMWKNKTVGLQLWDTAGQEDYDKLRPLSYPETDVFIVCFDVTSSTSFANVRHKWIHEIRHYCPNTPIILCGTKSDLKDNSEHLRKMERRGETVVSQDLAKKAAVELGCIDYVECSAKTQRGLKHLFDVCIGTVLDAEEEKERNKKRRHKLISTRCDIL